MEPAFDIFLALLRNSLCESYELEKQEKIFSVEMIQKIYFISKTHDMVHFVAQGISKLDIDKNNEIFRKIQQQQLLAVYRFRQLNYELEQICCALEKAKIPFIPLKGAVLRKYYPEPWMRTSCDIDILVKEPDLEKAIECLVTHLNYKNHGRAYHDVSLFSPNNIHLELHFDLVEDEYANEARKVLSKVWNYVFPKDGCQYFFEMTDEMFYFYHIAHMAKHFEFGGCGIRPFLDLWILDRFIQYDQSARNQLLEEGNLLIFATKCRKLSNVWFSNDSKDDISTQMQDFILSGGVYGNLENRIAVQQKQHGGKGGYLFSRIFLTYESLKALYPILQKHRWLTPIMEVRRWFKLLFKGRAKSSLHELSVNQTISREKVSQAAELLSELGLK